VFETILENNVDLCQIICRSGLYHDPAQLDSCQLTTQILLFAPVACRHIISQIIMRSNNALHFLISLLISRGLRAACSQCVVIG